MKISFADDNVEAICRQARLATKALGAESAGKLQRRLAELFNALRVTEFIAGRPHPLVRDRLGFYSLDLHGGKRLIFKPAQQPPPMKPDGGIDWAAVTAITITELGDYHD